MNKQIEYSKALQLNDGVLDKYGVNYFFDKSFDSLRGYALCFNLKSLSKYKDFVFEILNKKH